MSVWRYRAVDLRDPTRPVERRGELAGETAAEVRAALRAIGLQVLAVEGGGPPTRSGAKVRRALDGASGAGGDTAFVRWLRSRRIEARADVFDSLATLLSSGVPLLDSFDTLLAAGASIPRDLRRTFVAMRESLRSGASLSDAMRHHPSWFDPAEVAMIEAAQLGGTLATVLRELAERQAKSAQLGQRLLSALLYPAIVACVGLGVVVFLATKTLPQLSSILVAAKLEVPPLTAAIMAVGQGIARWWWLIAVVVVCGIAAMGLLLPAVVARVRPEVRARFDGFVPLVVRRLAVARAVLRIAELVRAGVPLAEALRVAAPAHRGVTVGLSLALRDAVRRIEEGSDVAGALDHPAWFDAELRRLVAVGEAGGDLDTVLVRLGERYERQVERLVDRLAATLEPAVLLVLAGLVGTVVMAAILPLVRLQEVL